LLAAGDTAGASRLQTAWELDGDQGYWRWRLARLQEQADTAYVAPRQFVKVYAALGRIAQAEEWLERAYDAHDGMDLLRVSPFYDPLRGSERYEAVLRRLGLPAVS
jgi:lipopolysaccharide biosynthesis regulator YciM